MKVHVIRDAGFPVEQYEQVMKLLQATAGLISFVKQSPTIEVIEPKELPVIIDGTLLVDEEGDLIKRENYTKVYDWEYFFYQCATYRQACKLPEDDFVILLTPKNNSDWYLAAFADDTRDVFVKTSEWGAYLDCDPDYPTAFTVMTQVLQKLYFRNMDRRFNEGHKPAVGCISDFCKHKHEVIFKFRTADVCMDCLDKMLNTGIPQEYFIQAFSLFETVRTEMLFKQRHHFELVQRRINVMQSINGKQGITIVIPDINKQIDINPKESALFLFYLLHPEGVNYASLLFDKNKMKLTSILDNFYEGRNKRSGTAAKLINNLLGDGNKDKGSLASDLSKMRKKFVDVLGQQISKEYYINGLANDDDIKKGIRLDRKLIQLDYAVKQHILGLLYDAALFAKEIPVSSSTLTLH